MWRWCVVTVMLVVLTGCGSPSGSLERISADYIREWKRFYPSSAFASGDIKSGYRFEDLSKKRIEAWISFNREALAGLDGLSGDISLDDRMDADLLRRQVLSELEDWEIDRVYSTSPSLYAGLVSQALTHILAREDLDVQDRWPVLEARLAGIRNLCAQGRENLREGSPYKTRLSIRGLEASAGFIETGLPGITRAWTDELPEGFSGSCLKSARSVRELADFLRSRVLSNTTLPDFLGRENYCRKLEVFTGLNLSPEELLDIADMEITEVRRLMEEEGRLFWKDRYPDEVSPSGFGPLMSRVISDMEADRESNQRDFLKLFVDLVDRAEDFIRDKEIATPPEKRTLITLLSPSHFAGAAVGGVYSAGPFNPEARTLFYLPTVPDDSPEDVKDGFYRSFNNHFNTMIVPHEIYPGHYMQAKIASTHPRQVRSLFADGLYVEGWATLCEIIALDAGFNGHNRLDRLAHLRKRLENAVRAFVSVQVHCGGWGREQLLDFAVNRGLLAPQFATNLWDRAMSSPFQLTSYFLGFGTFKDILENEKKLRGKAFRLKAFSDTVLVTGGVSVRFLPYVLGHDL